MRKLFTSKRLRATVGEVSTLTWFDFAVYCAFQSSREIHLEPAGIFYHFSVNYMKH